MHKLVILIQQSAAETSFDESWPQFLHLVEQMPGLIRESTSRVAHILYGDLQVELIHELYFEDLQSLQEDMASPVGQQAGQVLQRMTGGSMVLLISDHNEDELENIRRFQGETNPAQDEASDGE